MNVKKTVFSTPCAQKLLKNTLLRPYEAVMRKETSSREKGRDKALLLWYNTM